MKKNYNLFNRNGRDFRLFWILRNNIVFWKIAFFEQSLKKVGVDKQTNKSFSKKWFMKRHIFPFASLVYRQQLCSQIWSEKQANKKSSLTSSWANIKHICSTSCEAPLKKIFTWCCEDDSSKKLNRIFSKKTERKIFKKSKLSKRWKCHCLRGPLAFSRLRPHKRDILKVKSRVKSSFSAK